MKNQKIGVWVGFKAHMLLMFVLVCSACGELSNDRRPVVQVRYTSSGELVVLADRVLSVFDGELTQARFSFDLTATQGEWALGVSNDGNIAAVALNDSVLIFDLKMGRKIRTLSSKDLAGPSVLPQLNVETIGLSPDGQFLAVTTKQQSDDKVFDSDRSNFRQTQSLLLYRAATGERMWQRSSLSDSAPPDETETFSPPWFSEDGQRLIVRRWGKPDFAVFKTMTGEAMDPLVLTGVEGLGCFPSSDRSRILCYSPIVGAIERKLVPTVWSAGDASLLQSFPTLPSDCPLSGDLLWIDESPDHQFFARGEFSKCLNGSSSQVDVVVWNAEGKVLFRFPSPGFVALTFSPDSAHLAVAEGNDGVSVYRLSDGKKVGSHNFDRKAF